MTLQRLAIIALAIVFGLFVLPVMMTPQPVYAADVSSTPAEAEGEASADPDADVENVEASTQVDHAKILKWLKIGVFLIVAVIIVALIGGNK